MYQTDRNDECLICFRKKYQSADLLEFFLLDDLICQDCRAKFIRHKNTIYQNGLAIEFLYDYNEFFSQQLIQYKELYDEALAPIFIHTHIRYLRRKYRDHILVSVPSRQEKREQRGFDHVNKMFKELHLTRAELFINTAQQDQKKSSYQKRLEVHNFIRRNDVVLPSKSKILLIDDLFTTGTSIQSCYQLIKNEYESIKALAIAHQPLKKRGNDNEG